MMSLYFAALHCDRQRLMHYCQLLSALHEAISLFHAVAATSRFDAAAAMAFTRLFFARCLLMPYFLDAATLRYFRHALT